MAYQKNKPMASDSLNVSQADLEANFQAIDSFIGVNHGTFGSANEGKHVKISVPDFGSSPTFTSPDFGIYAKEYSVTGRNELFFSNNNPLFNDFPVSAGSYSGTSNGWTYLPSGLLLKWGAETVSGGAQTITFPSSASIPAFTAILTSWIRVGNPAPATDINAAITVAETTLTDIKFYLSKRTETGAFASTAIVSWFAIGKGI